MGKIVNYLYDECLSQEAMDFIEFMEHIAEHSSKLGFADVYFLENSGYQTSEHQNLDFLNYCMMGLVIVLPFIVRIL